MVRNLVSGPHQSSVTPAALMILFHLGSSRFRFSVNSSGVLPSGSAPDFVRTSLTGRRAQCFEQRGMYAHHDRAWGSGRREKTDP